MAKLAYRGLVWNRFLAEIDTNEPAHRPRTSSGASGVLGECGVMNRIILDQVNKSECP